MGARARARRPYQPGGTSTALSRQKAASSTNGSAERARQRLRIVQAALEEVRSGRTKAEAYEALKARARDPDDQFDEILPSLPTFYRLLARAEKAGTPSQSLFLDRPRRGRRPAAIDPEAEAFIRKQVNIGIYSQWSRLFNAVTERFGSRAPSRHVFNRYIASLDPAQISAARHGSRAAVVDSMPGLSVPSKRPHEYWVLDEMEVPVWMKAWCEKEKRLVATRPYAGVILEAHSRAHIGLLVFRPYSSGTEKGYVSDDITALFLTAALERLAPPETREFAGSLPLNLRMDNHPTHKELRALLVRHGVTVGKLRSRSPWANGLAESFVGTFKGLCEDILGADHLYRPAERAVVHPKEARSDAAAGSRRQPREGIIAVDDLLDYAGLVAELLRRADKYNGSPHSGIEGRSPRDVYHSTLDMAGIREGQDLLYALPASSVRVGKQLKVRGVPYSPVVAGRRVHRGETIVYRADPLGRGLWVSDGDRLHWVPRLDDFSREVPFKEWAKEQRLATRALSDEAQADLDAHLETIVGEGAVERGLAEAKFKKRKIRGRATKPRDSELERAGQVTLELDVPGDAVTVSSPPGHERPAKGVSPTLAPMPEAEPEQLDAAVPEEALARRLPRGLVRSRNPNIHLVR